MAAFRDFLPFQQARRGRPPKKQAKILDVSDQKVMAKLFKAVGLALGFSGGTYNSTRGNFEPAPYDFNRIIQAVDTDSYVKQGFNKYRELIWKEGWDIVSENPEAVDYLYQRLDFMELSMGQPIQNFLVEVTDQLVKFANCFVVKVRGELSAHFPQSLYAVNGKDPIIGYQIIPAETMEIERNKFNKVLRYRQNIWNQGSAGVSGFGRDDNQLPEWTPEEVIHLYVDRKPGRLFGTPFITAVMDDIIALRQIEEDTQNLMHRELFPLYKYMVGTDDNPAEPEEIEAAAAELANLRTEGGLVLPNRHDVEVIGAEGNALDITSYLGHFKERVCVGIGLAPHHLGMLMNGGNRSVTDRLDVALYDKIKTYQRYLASIFQLKIFSDLLLEGGFDPLVTPTAEGDSDRCIFRFNEIDVDTQVKKENHIIQKFQANVAGLEETRLALSLPADIDEEELLIALTKRHAPTDAGPGLPVAKPGANTSGPDIKTPADPSAGGAKNLPTKPGAALPSKGGAPNLPNAVKKQVGNKSQPANQFGRKMSPAIRHSEWIEEAVTLLDDEVT